MALVGTQSHDSMPGIDIPQVLSCIRFQGAHVTRMYLVGSRLWGTNERSSDFDLLVVVDGLATEIPRSQHKNQYDITLLTEKEFLSRLVEGSFIETVCCLLGSDNSHVLQEGTAANHLVQEIAVVEAWVSTRHFADREKAQKFWLKGKQRESFKILQHMIMAESVIRGLRKKMEETARQLNCISLSVSDLHGFIEGGKEAADWSWFGRDWKEVEDLHSTRLKCVA